MGLAPFRRSRVFLQLNFIARRRRPIGLLEWPRWPSPIGQEVRLRFVNTGRIRWRRQTDVVATGGRLHRRDWDSSRSALAISRGSCGAAPYTSSSGPRVPGMLVSLLAFAAR